MKQDEYQDSDFNMRAVFYYQTKYHSENRNRKKAEREPNCVQKLRENVKLHKKPLSTRRTVQL